RHRASLHFAQVAKIDLLIRGVSDVSSVARDGEHVSDIVRNTSQPFWKDQRKSRDFLLRDCAWLDEHTRSAYGDDCYQYRGDDRWRSAPPQRRLRNFARGL